MLRAFLHYLRNVVRGPPSADAQMNRIVPAAADAARRKTLVISDTLCAVTDTGRVRKDNEDVFHLSDDGRIMIVADGMGGHDAGEVASALATATIAEHLGGVLPSLANDDGTALEQAMRAALDAAQEQVLVAGQAQKHGCEMGCTLIVACVRGDTIYTCHVGDVRGYLWSGQELRAVTRDHSVVAELIVAGVLTAGQARAHTARNEVLQAIGMPLGFNPDVNICPLKPGDRVLLCSDGLWEMLSDQEIASIAGANGSMRQLATQLVDRANDAGGRDNVSVVMYEHRPS